MTAYIYKGRKEDGKIITGRMTEKSLDAVVAALNKNHIVPIAINKAPQEINVGSLFRKFKMAAPVAITDLVILSRQMYTLTKAGVPLNRAIRGLAETARTPMLLEALSDICLSLDSGRELSQAMADHPKLFSSLFLSMIAVGENTGRLDEAFMRIANYMELELSTKKQIKAATRYPIMVVVAISAAIIIINIMVIPAFATVFDNLNAELPWATRFLIATSDFMITFWPLILAAIIGTIGGFLYYIKTPAGRMRWDRKKLKIPLFGSILKRSALARFARAFAMSSKSGVPILESLNVVSKAVDNVYVSSKIMSMREGIERGKTLTSTAVATELFTPLVLQMIAVGEETGELDDLLDEVGTFYESEVDYDIKKLADAIEPILIVVMGVMVLILALGVFLPMWDLGSAFNGR